MPSLKYESIYKKALTMVNDLELATYTEEDFYDTLCEWLTTTSSLPLLRKKFSIKWLLTYMEVTIQKENHYRINNN